MRKLPPGRNVQSIRMRIVRSWKMRMGVLYFFEREIEKMAWIALFVAGLGECFWSAMMKLSDGFSRLGYSIATVAGMIFSFAALIAATKTLPLSLAYPIWTGIGAVGSVVIGVVFFKDRINPITWVFVALLVIGVVGIKLTAGE